MADNCTLSAGGYGSITAKCETIVFGMEITSAEDDTRNGRVFYLQRVAVSDFMIGLVFRSTDDRDIMSFWLQNYIYKVSDPNNSVVQPIRVTVAARRFDMTGIPERGVEFGQRALDQVRRMGINFKGAKDAQAYTAPTISSVVTPANADPASRYFYPTATPLVGSQAGVDSASYDSTPPVVPDVATPAFRAPHL